MIYPCICGHEKADHQARLGQHGNYTPCCVAGCQCGGFRKAKPLKALDLIADVVLRYRPKPKSEPAKQRKKKRRKIEKEK